MPCSVCGAPTAFSVYRCASHPRASEYGSGAEQWAGIRVEAAFVDAETIQKARAVDAALNQRVLMVIVQRGRVRSSIIAEVLGEARSTITNALNNLARRSLVERSRRGFYSTTKRGT